VAKGRPRMTRGGRCYTPKKTRDFEEALALQGFAQYKDSPLKEALVVDITVFIKRPKSVTRRYHTIKPDADNFCKAILDSMTGVLWIDDCQVIKVTTSKQYCEGNQVAGIELKVHEVV